MNVTSRPGLLVHFADRAGGDGGQAKQRLVTLIDSVATRRTYRYI